MHSNKDNLQVIYEDNHLIVINKRIGDIVQGDKTGDLPLSEVVKDYIKQKYNKPGAVFLGVVHRLDRPTSGIVVFARTSKALSRMNELLKKHQIKKTYQAIVKKRPEQDNGTLIHYLRKNSVYVNPIDNAKKAILHYRCLSSSDTYHLLSIDLETGRHHQIRAQLAKIGSPIKGDLKYGFSRSNKNGGISLHAVAIEFIHPVKKEKIKLTAPAPETDIWNVF